jgi:hypothetical protein
MFQFTDLLFSWQGVAPDATILAYKVSSNELGGGLTDDETLIDAFIMAYEAGVGP